MRIAREDAVLKERIFPMSAEIEWDERNGWYIGAQPAAAFCAGRCYELMSEWMLGRLRRRD
ncbi:MAG TPA: hypothetical protein VEK79_02110 [Thermoanaerobaculia bacterium]|nr:hypothetical protein [Thermoanaerobaculia bacterium]